METTTSTRTGGSIFGLIRALSGDSKTFIRQEIQLAKTEVMENLASMGKDAAMLAVGGFVAYAGLIVFLVALGGFVAWGLMAAGLSPVLAAALGLAIISLLIIGTGYVLVMKGLKLLKKESLSPKRTLYTLQELKEGTQTHAPTTMPAQPTPSDEEKPSSKELQTCVEATETRMTFAMEELGRRLSPKHINAQVKGKLQENPYRSGLVALAAGVVSGFVLRRKLRHA
jgi:hypothetical protein